MKYSNVYCLKLVIARTLKIWLRVVNPYIFLSKQEEKNYEHPGKRYFKSKEKKESSKKNGKMVMLSFWLQNYMEHACKSWFYPKKIDNIFRIIFRTGYSTGISLHAGAFKKEMQRNSSIELAFISR